MRAGGPTVDGLWKAHEPRQSGVHTGHQTHRAKSHEHW